MPDPDRLDARGRTLRQVLYEVAGAVAGSGQVISVLVPTLTLTNRLTARAPDVGAGVSLTKGPTTIRPATVVAGVGLSSTISGGPAAGTYLLRPGVALTNAVAPAPTLSVPAAEIVQVKYDLTKVAGGATQAAVGTAFTNPANATGLNNGVNATSAGSALAVTQGIELSYADSVGKAELSILSASLAVYYTVVDALALCTRTLSYNIGAGLVTLSTGTGSVAGPSSTFTIPITTWAHFDALQVRLVTVYAAAAAASNATLDAAVLTLTATRTDAF